MIVLRPDFEKRDGLVAVVTQDAKTGEILMVAYTDEAGYKETLETGFAVYWSTSRGERWKKGETSGDLLKVTEVLVDCDGDAVIYKAIPLGKGACHTEARTCFYRNVLSNELICDAPKAEAKDSLAVINIDVHSSLLL